MIRAFPLIRDSTALCDGADGRVSGAVEQERVALQLHCHWQRYVGEM